MRKHSPTPTAARQGGAATLIVVMLLFFIMSMVAAYTSRNLIFEQRTSANQYRSSQAFESAEAGMEWALAQLNAGRTTNACVPSTNDGSATDQSFAQRYLTIDRGTGVITPRAVSGGGAVQPRCVFNSIATDPADWNWSCACPVAGTPTTALAAPGGAGPAPAFLMRFRRSPSVTGRNDLIQLEVNSCTRLDDACLTFPIDDRGGTGDGVAATSVILALRGAVTRAPTGALSVAGALSFAPGSTATLALTNQDNTVGGVTLHTAASAASAATVVAAIAKTGVPGVPPDSTVVAGDPALQPASVAVSGRNPAPSTAERVFALYFGVFPDVYLGQPGMVEVDCSSDCAAAAVNLALSRNPGRAIRVRGSATATTVTTLTLDVNVGTAAVAGPPAVLPIPALLILDPNVNLAFSNGVTLVGMVYGRRPGWTWTVTGGATIQGAAVAETDLAVGGTGAMSVVYNKDALTALRVAYGTFVRVPGSWKDFQ
ncbi:PilX_N domain-containing protein [Rubrivivax sp. A210]|uniref:pilus assembly PilX family protein n=1 Tax=Rubrivivax sp. A210 TaxID=2772301 RepID=UPI001919939A|nr:pilus assembly PilX N-terminal domain-containing protein [Rubrivivax sp. A210]CAD5372084.1 PilX_N domain-containing protein [Rubrivivax sp. A210]